MKRQILSLLTIFLVFSMLMPAAKSVAAPYYEGKVIALVVPSAPGGGYDRMARLVARYLPEHIPGNPSMVVQNMPGAGGIIAANHLYRVAKPNGFTIGEMQKPLVFSQLAKLKGVRYDVTKFRWIGSSSVESTVFAIRSDLPYKTYNDLLKAKGPIYVGGGGAQSISTQYALMLQAFTGANIKIVDYRAHGEIYLAIERKELDGVAASYTSCRIYVERNLLRPLLRSRISQMGIENLPVNEDFTDNPMGKTVMAMHALPGKAGKSFAAPPGTPDNIMDILRDAFAKAVKSPQLQAEAQKVMVEVEYVSAEEVLSVMNYILSQPAETVKEFTKYVSQ
jgi:tripartite-type tricarboxylate transporter receptor subunit TctC